MRKLFCLSLLLFAFSACDCGDDPIPGLDGGVGDGAVGDGAVGDSGFVNLTDSGPGSICLAEGSTCDRATDTCCSGVCGDNGICSRPIFCAGPAEACASPNDCCSLRCDNGFCSQQLCQSIGSDCASGGDCCSTICGSNGTCEAVPGGDSCLTLGEACNVGGDCCSTNCQGGVCVRAYYCQANGDICAQDGDCCGNVCSATSSMTAGRCQLITGGGGGGCIQGGNPCPGGGSNCCSRICVDVGSGAPVCQVAGGCRLTGEWCPSDDACCGGGVNPNGSVVCQAAPAGRCDNGQACNPVGNICGAPVLPGGGSINASQNCCDGKKEVCKLDSSGIPRCFGGCPTGDCDPNGPCPTGYDGTDPNCCIAAGSECQFRDQCCDGRPCVPAPNGAFVCADDPMCLPQGDPCVPGNTPDCCPGTACLVVDAEGGLFACQGEPIGLPDAGINLDAGPGVDGGPVPDGGPLPDAGGLDAGPICLPNGQVCAMGTECCSGICGEGGLCEAAPVCQPQDATCSISGDCCQGLECIVPAGGTAGACRPGSTCSNLAQSCTMNVPCCGGLRCVAGGTLNNCDGTSACVCAFDF